MSNGIDRSQILSQLKVILTPQEYTACEGLNYAELSAKLREALSNNGNLGVGDTFTFGAMPEITTTPVQQQKPILPTFGPEASIPQLTQEQAQDVAMQNLWAMNANLATAQRETDSDKRDNATTLLMNTEARELYYLDKSRSPQGLTYREYLEGMRGDLRAMLLKSYPQMDSAKINLDERLDLLDADQIRQFEHALISAEAGKLDKNEVLRMFADSTQTVETRTYVQDGTTHTETRVKINPPHSHTGGEDEKIQFEDLYKAQRGVEFNPEKIRQYLIDGTETFFNDPLENGFSNTTLDDLHKHATYTQRLPKSYIQAFGQPYRAEYLSALSGSDYDTSTAYGVSPVRLDGQLNPSNEGIEFIIPTRDITQGTSARELDQKELKRFSANMLYNILNTTYNMLKGYYDGAWEQLKSGNVGTAAVQGFLGFGEMLSGQDLTVRSQMDNVEKLLAKATQLKNMDDDAFEQNFEELFKEISGTSFDIGAMQNFAQLTMKGVKTDTDEYDEAVKRAFGSNRTGDADSQFSILNPINSVTDVVAFLAGSEVIGGTKLFAQLGSKSLQLTAKTATKLGFNPASKGVQAGVRLMSSSPVSALNMMTYTGLTEIGGTAFNNLAERMNIKYPAMNGYASVLDNVDKSLLDDDMIRILVDMTKQGVMGSVAPFIGAVATKTGNSLAGVFSKGNPTAIQRSFSTLAKAENKTLNAQSLMKDYLSAVDGSTFTKAQEVISKSSAFITEVGGFTGYSTLEHIAEGLITGELDLDSIDLGEEFKGQLEGLATLKGVARFIQMRKSGSVARGVQDKALNDMTEQLKNYDITDVGGQYRVLDKTSGKFETFNSPEQAINHLFQTMLFKSVVAKAEQAIDGATDGVEWRKMNIGGEEVEVAVTKTADGKETVDFSKARKLNANGEYEHFALTTERDLLSGEVAQDPTLRPRRLDSKGGKDPFELTKQFDEQTLALTGNDVLVQVGTDKDGKPIMKLSPEYEELITNISKQIREIALSQEGGAGKIDGKDDPNYDYTQDKGIVGIMHRMGFTANGQFFHRSKSVQSLHDKIQNALISDPDMPLSALVTKEVRDAVGVRSVREGVDLKNDPDVKALLDAGDRKSAIDLAIEKESAHVFDALMKYIDSVAEGTNEVEITSISNYMGKDGIPYFTERQLNRLRAYAEEKGVPLLIIERVNSYSERENSDDVFKEKATTKVRGSGYTALQMNFRTKDGFVYEWQYRGTGVNKFAEGEHIPYDLRTNKDIVGKNEELHALFDPIKELLSESKMSEPQFEEYNNYLTAHYEYLRLTELGIVDGSNPPKLPRGFDVRLRAENLELLHEKAEATKKNPEKKDEIYKEYTDEIARRERENPDNFTDQSYTELAEEAKRTRTTSEYEAEVRLGINLEGSNPTEIRQIINECKNENGAISEYYLKESESLLNSGLSAKDVITYLQILKGTSKPVTEEPAIPDRTPDEFGEYVQSQRTLEAFEVSGLKELYEADGKTVEQLFNEKKPDGSPRFSYFDLIQIFKSKNKDFSLSLVETTVYDPVSGQDVPKFEMDVFKRINKCLKDNPHRHEIEDYIQHHLLNNDDIDSAKLKLFVESLDNNSTVADYDVLRSILTDKSVSADKKADAIQSYKDLSPEQKTKIHQGYTADKKAKFSDIFKSATGEEATGESRNIERLISESPLLSDIHPLEIAELKEGSFEQVKESLEMLELFVQKNPHATAQDKAYLLSLHSTSIKQGLILDTKSIIKNDLLKDVRLLETLIQVPTFNTNDGQYLRLQVLSQIDYSDPTVFKNNYKYILNSGRYSTKDIIEIMKNGIDYPKRQTELSGQNIDETTRKVLLQTKDISDINGIKETVTNIRQLLGKIEHPDMIADVLNRLNIKDYNAFNQFINRIDMNKLYELAPRMRNFNERDMAVFLGFHYKNGTSSFDKTTLTSEQGFTEFLSKHYLDAGNMSDFLAAFPLTNRNIGALPEGWASNVSNPEGLDSRIQNVIDNFRQTKDMTALANELGQVLNKKVNVDNLGEGVYGHGFKIDVEGSTTVVLKLFFEKPDISVDRTLHGRSIETQTGFYLNGNSNRFVHTFFGRICSHADRDGYMVTQFMGDGVTPIITSGNTAGISIIPTDVSKGHNEANNIIFDLGGTLIKDNNGKNISFDVLKHKRK